MIDISIKQANKDGSVESRIVTLTREDNKILVPSALFQSNLMPTMKTCALLLYALPEGMTLNKSLKLIKTDLHFFPLHNNEAKISKIRAGDII